MLYRAVLVIDMKKKEKRKLKKKNKVRVQSTIDTQAYTQDLEQRIKKLERKLKQRDSTIEELIHQLNESKARKNKKRKPGKSVSKTLFSQQTTRVAIDQRKAWRRHGYLRDRYEYHLSEGQDKANARILADKDLRGKFGEDAGYSEQELEQILS